MRPLSARKILLVGLGVLIALAGVWCWAGRVEPPPQPPAAAIAVATGHDAKVGVEPAAAPDQPAAQQRQPVAVSPSIAGRLVQDGAPLAGIEVRAVSRRGLADEVDAGRAWSDREGRFVLGALEPGCFALVADGEGVPREPTPWYATVQAGQCVELGDLDVPRPGSITGRVVDAAGPRAGVSVIVRRIETADVAAIASMLEADRADQVATTDATGRYRFARLLPGPHAVIAQDSQYRDSAVPTTVVAGAEVGVADLLLQPGREVRGFVRDAEGHAIADAKVTAMRGVGIGPKRIVSSDHDGSFRLQGLGLLCELTIEAAGFDTLEARVLPDAMQPLQLVLARATAVTGTVSGHGGASTVVVVDAELDANRRMPPTSAYRVLDRPLRVAADGSFRIEGLPAASYSIIAMARGVGRSPSVPFAVPCREPLQLAIVPCRPVAVVVRDELGVPLPDVELVQADTREYESLSQAAP